jgi:amidohydrolase
MRILLATLALTSAVSAFAQIPADQLKTQVTTQLPVLEKTYLQLHQAPELSRQETKTSAFLAGELKRLGYTVTDHVGVYPDGQKAFGIVGILKNGTGPTVLIRTDMDALPVAEATGLAYASNVHAQTADHQDVGVMHACGHDLHMTVFLGTATELVENKTKWHGTVILVGQPAEEIILGAKAMLADDFYKRFPKPDFILDEHDANDYPTGTIGMAPGPLLAASTSVYVTFHGVGSHGSTPQLGKDPIVMASEFVMMAQTIVSRQTAAQSPAVLTVGTFHAGTKNNIIPDDATLGLTLRSYDAKVMANMIADVRRTANAVAAAYGVADDRMPTITIPEETGPTINDAALEERMHKVAVATLGADRVLPAVVIMGSEDVGYFSLDGTIPFMIFRLGAADPAKFADAKKTGKPLPGLHSALFAPVYKPAIETGVEAMSAMAASLLQ